MNDKLFVIAIGGTGMRCLESFVHLCAVGMFDNQEIEILTLDTDQSNGNKGRVEALIEKYSGIKTAENGTLGGTPNADTFFSAKLNLYRFYTNYNTESRITYRAISQLSKGEPEIQEENKMLSDLFLEKDTVQEFHLDHGYRAQTHLGSHLMYHGIIEAARKLAQNNEVTSAERELDQFLIKLQKSSDAARVFVFGSVFGGTGASSIPIIPVAFKDAVFIRSGEKETLDLSKVKFGSTLLTEYFSFKKPDLQQMAVKKDSIIADSSFFPINSQAALQFYQADPTVQSVYKKMYHIGWPIESKPLSNSKDNQTITGGATQKNNCHIVELLCACAAYNFFITETDFSAENAEYVFRSAEMDNGIYNFDGKDFMGDIGNAGNLFTNKLGAFLSFSHIVLSVNQGAWGSLGTRGFLKQLEENGIIEYSAGIKDEETKAIDDFVKYFAYDFDSDKNFVPGWIYQVRNSVAPGKFLFKPEAFKESWSELEKLDVGALFIDEKNHWDKSLLSSRYNGFVKNLTSNGQPEPRQKVNTAKERFLAHIYNGITISQKFNL
jgi:hypothetical protein